MKKMKKEEREKKSKRRRGGGRGRRGVIGEGRGKTRKIKKESKAREKR